MTALKSWVSPKARKGLPSKIGGRGLFAKQRIAKDEIISAKAGHIIDKATLEANRQIIRGSERQITDELFLAPLSDTELEDSMVYLNHSCDPNAGAAGNILIIAMRTIEPGEEITSDYATTSSDPSLEFLCNCQAKSCRKKITGHDWKNPELQERYKGYFAWHIQRKIQKLAKTP